MASNIVPPLYILKKQQDVCLHELSLAVSLSSFPGRWYMASRFNGRRKYGERLISRPLSINIVFLDALTVDNSWTWSDGSKIRVEYDKVRYNGEPGVT